MEQTGWIEELAEAWNTNNRIHLYLLDRIAEEGLECTLSKRGGERRPSSSRMCIICAATS
ncbi:hypothetical protein LJK87_42445 [Paenibacillus sp. P25]|nr:hypothetical protein LJK87_42445 [Paenibacillus sp. P25]